MTEYFTIPHMVVSRDDIVFFLKDKELIKKALSLSDEQMQKIANKMSDSIMNEYWSALENIFAEVINVSSIL